jgi:predicted membrane chloride channel (bestrophin family)
LSEASPIPSEGTPLLGRVSTDGDEVVSARTGSLRQWGKDKIDKAKMRWAARKNPDVQRKNLKQWGKEKMDKVKATMSVSYNCYSLYHSHCYLDTNEEGETKLGGYDVQKLTTMRVFYVYTGTVLESPILWIEMTVIAVIYFLTFTVLMRYRWQGFSEFVGSDTEVRAFISMFSTLIGLLLSFYTSLNIGRWWNMRTTGVENIAQGASKLTILLSQGVTRNAEILNAVRRYAIASLMLFFLKDEDGQEQTDRLVKREILTEDEAKQLANVGDCECYPEALWVWLANIVTQCNQAGLVKGPPHYCALLAAVQEGRQGAAVIKTFLGTPIPMGYVHLLGLMVKLHNVILALLMALVSVKHAGRYDSVSTARAVFRCFFMPFLYNSILIINDELTDPFGRDMSDFPAHVICRRLHSDLQSFVEMGDNLPDWIETLDLKKEEA